MTEKNPTHNATAAAGPDSQLDLKKRARRRLVGAIALVLLAVIVLPMVMDQEPKPLTQDIQIRIPSQEPGTTSFISRIKPNQPSPTPTPLPAETRTPPPAPAATVAPATDAGTQTTAPQAEKKAEPPKPLTVAAPPPEKPADAKATTAAKAPAAAPNTESTRATAKPNDEHWLVQLGAYQDQGNVKSLQGKIKELGYPSFTEKVDTPQGVRIRVRCGPFSSREAAEKAQARLKKIGAGSPFGGTVAQVQ